MRHHPHGTQPNITGPPPDVLENLHGLPPGELQKFLNNMTVPHGPSDLDRQVNNSRKVIYLNQTVHIYLQHFFSPTVNVDIFMD
jgi:hypothetical protein